MWKQRVMRIALAVLGVVLVVIVLLVTVPQVRAAVPGIAQFIPPAGPASGLTVRYVGPSMEPEFNNGQYVTVMPLSSDRPQRCDVVMYHPPTSPSELYVSRVVALGGDSVSYDAQGVLVNGKTPCTAKLHGSQGIGGTIKQVESSLYFVVGDNVQDSTDSRMFGAISRSSIVGYLPG